MITEFEKETKIRATVLDIDKGNVKQKIYFIISMLILRCGGIHTKIFD